MWRECNGNPGLLWAEMYFRSEAPIRSVKLVMQWLYEKFCLEFIVFMTCTHFPQPLQANHNLSPFLGHLFCHQENRLRNVECFLLHPWRFLGCFSLVATSFCSFALSQTRYVLHFLNSGLTLVLTRGVELRCWLQVIIWTWGGYIISQMQWYLLYIYICIFQ